MGPSLGSVVFGNGVGFCVRHGVLGMGFWLGLGMKDGFFFFERLGLAAGADSCDGVRLIG